MPWGSVTLRPGVDVERTFTANEAGYSASNLIRFKAGLAQKMGGWEKFYPFNVGGVPRNLHAWQDFNDVDHLAVGSTTLLGVITDDQLLDITPQTLISNFTPDFSTIVSTPEVIADDPNIANVTSFDSVEFLTPVSVGGIILSGVYPIDFATATTTYQITARSNATSTVSNDGDVPVFDSTSGSATIQVTFPDHGLAVGESIVFPIPTTVGGIVVLGTYAATAVGGANVFSIAVDEEASSTQTVSMNGGDCRLKYYIALGPPATASGYGTNGYGDGGYGTGVTSTAQAGTPITATDWTMDNWGQTLLACPEGGGIYEWTPDTGFQNAKLVAGAPIYNGGILVAAPAQILIAWGSTVEQTIGVDRDPLTYVWSDQLDYQFWTPGVVNPATGAFSQAGSNRIPTGSKIVAGLTVTQQVLLWTDLDLWSINYIGNPTIGTFGQNKIGSSCGAIGSHAIGQLGSTVFWMGRSNFFAFTGGNVSPIPCSVWDTVFQDLDTENAWKVRCAPNTPFNEVWWFYPSASGGSGENDSYVKLNIAEGAPVWDYGPINALARSAWIDQSVLGMPIGASPQGLIYRHETTQNADGQPLLYSFSTGYWSIAEGENVSLVDMVIPDFKYGLWNGTQGASVQITFNSVMFPGGPVTSYGPYTATSATTFIPCRIRGRQLSMQVSGSDLNSFVRLGRVKWRMQPSGRFGGGL